MSSRRFHHPDEGVRRLSGDAPEREVQQLLNQGYVEILMESASSASRAGRQRQRCLDRAFVDVDQGLFVVVDAAGSAGPIDATLQSLREATRGHGDPAATLRRGFAEADARVRSLHDCREIGACATAVAMWVRGRVATLASTRDTAAFELGDTGPLLLLGGRGRGCDLGREAPPLRQVLGSGSADVMVTRMLLCPGDRILLCSDGVLDASGDLPAEVVEGLQSAAVVDAATLLRPDAEDDQALVWVDCGSAPGRAPRPPPPTLLHDVSYPLPSHAEDDLRSPSPRWVVSQASGDASFLDRLVVEHRRLSLVFETCVSGARRSVTTAIRSPRPTGFEGLDLLVAVHHAVIHHLRKAEAGEHLWPGSRLTGLKHELAAARDDVLTYRLVLQ